MFDVCKKPITIIAFWNLFFFQHSSGNVLERALAVPYEYILETETRNDSPQASKRMHVKGMGEHEWADAPSHHFPTATLCKAEAS